MIFKTTDELAEVLPNTRNLDIDKLFPYFDQAIDNFLVPQVGQELFDRISSKYIKEQSLTDDELNLLKRFRTIVSRIGLALYLPIGEIMIGNDGLTTTGKSETRTAAYDNQVTRLTDSLYVQAFDGIQRLLTWLQTPSKLAIFEEYANSPEYTRQLRGLIRNAVEFSDIYDIGKSSLTFQAVQSELLNVEEDILLPLIGLAHYEHIKAAVPAGDYKALRRAAQKAIVFQTVANVIQLQQNVQLDAQGLRVYQTSQNGSLNVKSYRAPTPAEREDAAAAAQARADFFFERVSEIVGEINHPGANTFEREILTTGKIAMF